MKLKNRQPGFVRLLVAGSAHEMRVASQSHGQTDESTESIGDATMSVAPKLALNIEILLDVILQLVAVIEAVLGLFGIQSL